MSAPAGTTTGAPVGSSGAASPGTETHRAPSAAQLVLLVARREVGTRMRDKGFLIGSAVMLLLILGFIGFQVVSASSDDPARIGVAGGSDSLAEQLEALGEAQGVPVTAVDVGGAAELRDQVRAGDVEVGLDLEDGDPRLVVRESADAAVSSVVQSAVDADSVQRQLDDAGVTLAAPPRVEVDALDPQPPGQGERVGIAAIGVGLTYFLLILFGQFVAQGVVEEKSSRVVELLLATMRPWQLLAGKVLGLGLLGLAQMTAIAAAGLGGALAFDVFTVPGDALGTVLQVLGWFVLGYAFYAALFAAGASLVSRQEDLGSVLTPMTLLLVGGFLVALQAIDDPSSTLATVTSLVPGLSPMVMPVRTAAGAAAGWEVALSLALMLLAIALVVRLGGRIYAGALLRTGGKVKFREALRAGRS